jgi:DNA polymerase III subunit gamma/tau
VSEAPSLYRRHRPLSFDDVVGQDHVVRTLRNAVERDRVHHAYLFVGSRGTGKTSMAKILARCLNCERGPTITPCGECESCLRIAASTSLDVIEMDAASNRSVDDIRELRERVGYMPAAGRFKVYILDEAHMLTKEAWNAFLKTLEEPPPNTVFVLATTEAHKVMPTIVDRCQRFDFQRPSVGQIAAVVERVAEAEAIDLEEGATSMIARAANGSFRDALGTLDQLVAYCGPKLGLDEVLTVLGVADAELLFEAADAIAEGDGKAVLACVDRLAVAGRDLPQFARDLVGHLRQLLVVRTTGTVPDSFSVTPAQEERLRTQSERLNEAAIVRAIDALSEALAGVRDGDEPRTALEVALIKAAHPALDASLQGLSERVSRLERELGGGDGPAPPKPNSGEEARGPEPPETEAADGGGDSNGAPQAEGDPAPDLERIKGVWPALVDRVREGSEVLSAAIQNARPLAVDSERITIGLPASASFQKRKAEAQENMERFVEAVRAIAGRGLRPVYVLLDSEKEGAGASELSEEELIAQLKEEFDAEEFEAGEAA